MPPIMPPGDGEGCMPPIMPPGEGDGGDVPLIIEGVGEDGDGPDIIKGVGEGLTIPLNQCEFRKMSAQKWKLSDVAQNQLEKANWKFYSCLLGDEWVFSAAQDGNLLSTEQDLIVRIIDPNSDDNFREQ